MAELSFNKEELAEIDRLKEKFPTNKSITLRVLWIAQKKYGHVKPEVQALVAETLDLPESHVHGVASFYTQYYKEEMGKFVLDVCTCLSCQLCGGYDVLHQIEDELGIKAGETTDDGMFSVQSVECLGACGYAPMVQITNGVYANNLTEEKVSSLLKNLREGKVPEFESMIMRQNEKRIKAASE